MLDLADFAFMLYLPQPFRIFEALSNVCYSLYDIAIAYLR